jgi:hypothetical protein
LAAQASEARPFADPQIIAEILAFAGMGLDGEGSPFLHLRCGTDASGQFSVEIRRWGVGRIGISIRSGGVHRDPASLVEALEARNIQVCSLDLD